LFFSISFVELERICTAFSSRSSHQPTRTSHPVRIGAAAAAAAAAAAKCARCRVDVLIGGDEKIEEKNVRKPICEKNDNSELLQ
jgi:hypothetical protein